MDQFYKVTVYNPLTYIVKANNIEDAIEQAKDKAAWGTFSMPECFDVRCAVEISEDKVKTINDCGEKIYVEV